MPGKVSVLLVFREHGLDRLTLVHDDWAIALITHPSCDSKLTGPIVRLPTGREHLQAYRFSEVFCDAPWLYFGVMNWEGGLPLWDAAFEIILLKLVEEHGWINMGWLVVWG